MTSDPARVPWRRPASLDAVDLARDFRVGVVVPNKNGERFLRECLDSILTQDYPFIDCVVMDSESDDESLSVLREYGERIAWYSQPDRCSAEAINRGWQILDAPILAWLNSDDLWEPGAVSRVVETFVAHPEADVVSGECYTIDESGSNRFLGRTGPFDLARSFGKADHLLMQAAVFMKRRALERVGFLREMWLHDHDLWLRLGLNAVFVHIDDVLASARDRFENLGQEPSLAGPMRVRLIEDFLSRGDLPPELRALERSARSWAQWRAAYLYLRRRELKGGLRHLGRAVRIYPRNGDLYRTIGKQAARAAMNRVNRALQDRRASTPTSESHHVPRDNVDPADIERCFKLGVVVLSSGSGEFLSQALASVATQDHPFVECVVVNSQSTAEPLDGLDQFGDRFTWISQPFASPAEAINAGWQLTRGDILAWLNAEDLWAAGAAIRAVEAFVAHPDADVVSGECGTIDEKGSVIGVRPTGPFDLRFSIERANPILDPRAVFIRRTALERIGYLRDITLYDHDLWLRLGLQSNFVHVSDVLGYRRTGASSQMRDTVQTDASRVKLMTSFLARDDVPPELKALERRSISWAHLRVARDYFVSSRQLRPTLSQLVAGVRADPGNVDALRALARRSLFEAGTRVARRLGIYVMPTT